MASSLDDLRQKFPAISKQMMSAESDMGTDISSPEGFAEAANSRTADDREARMAAASGKRDMRILDRVLRQPVQTPPLNPNITEEAATEQFLRDQYDIKTRGLAASQAGGRALNSALTDLETLSDYNRSAYKQRRLKQLNAEGPIDDQILELRKKAVMNNILERSRNASLPQHLRDQVLSSRMRIFGDQIDELEAVKQARKAAANDLVDEEINSKEDQIRAATSRVSALSRLIKQVEDSGTDREAIAGLQLDLSQAKAKLAKARKSGAGADNLTPGEDVIYQHLLNNFAARGYIPTSVQKEEARRQARQISDLQKTRQQSIDPSQAAIGLFNPNFQIDQGGDGLSSRINSFSSEE